MPPIISVEHISKRYTIQHNAQSYLTLRDIVSDLSKLPMRLLKKQQTSRQKEDFWALKDVNFDIAPGEAVGIIGRNGAGKSTLLKVLSRITPPTAGKITIRGRVASLLEVGTGFHPELTGRENIFLNGAILGMHKQEISNKFAEIVAFAEIEKFLDTPVKRYSSGMYVRLAFAVAAHLEPEILLVDEVLAVGDVNFQKKCLGKMNDVAKKEGRTVLFVSHNMAAIKNLCTKCILLNKGQTEMVGATEAVIAQYLTENNQETTQDISAMRYNRKGTGSVKFSKVTFMQDGKQVVNLMSGKNTTLLLDYFSTQEKDLHNIDISVGVDNFLGERVCALSTELVNQQYRSLVANGKIQIEIPKLPFIGGRYNLTLFMKVNNEITDWVTQAVSFQVVDGDFYGTGKIFTGQGNILIEHAFK